MFSPSGKSRAYTCVPQEIPLDCPSLFLTFDDGPSTLTSEVLDLLDLHQAKASFFAIAENLVTSPYRVIDRLISSNHTLGNHSLDHKYRYLFGSEKILSRWILASQELFMDYTGDKPLGFRPPAGVVTPPMVQALHKLDIPLVLWTKRFYDRNLTLSESSINRYLDSAKSRDIILLHDSQRPYLESSFKRGLNSLLAGGRQRGFHFSALSRDHFKPQF